MTSQGAQIKPNRPEPEKIRKMFGEIAANYDFANTVLSVGVHHLWRRRVVRESFATEGDKILDCATGTGDLAFTFKAKVGASGSVVATDFCRQMLITAKEKAKRRRIDVAFEQADVLQLPYSDGRFDISSIAFGIRNVSDPPGALCELARVTRPGGRVMILEFGQPKFPGIRWLYQLYSRHLLPRIGGWLTGRTEAYQYLNSSTESFVHAEDFVSLMRETGLFEKVSYWPLSFGIAYLYRGEVAERVYRPMVRN